MPRFLWVDANNEGDWVKAQTHRFTGLFYAVTDPPAVLNAKLVQTRARGYAAGVYMAWNWPQFDGLDGASLAERMHTQCAPLTGPYKVQFDIEEHDPDLIVACLERWRALNPRGDTSWTMESMQSGWMDSEFVKSVVDCKVRVVPQCYTGPMLPVCPRAACNRLEDIGFPRSIVSPFYDAAKLPLYWDGFAFAQGRLP